MKHIHLFIALLFLIFVAVQYNDPDYYIWMPVYAIIAFLAYTHFLGKPQKLIALLLTAFLGIWSMFFIPDLISWIQDGAPNIAGSMKAETPHIELMRELFGLIISLTATIYYGTRKK